MKYNEGPELVSEVSCACNHTYRLTDTGILPRQECFNSMTRLCINFDLPFCDYRDKEGTESNFDGKASQSQENFIPEGETAALEDHNSENMQDIEEQMQGNTVHFEASEATQPKDPGSETSFSAREMHGISAEQSEEEENCVAVENEGQSFRSGNESQVSEFVIDLPEQMDSAQRSENEKPASIDEITNGEEFETSLATSSNSQRHVIEASSPEGLCSSHGISETGSSKTRSTQSQNSGDGRDIPHSEWVHCETSLNQNQPQIPALKLTLMPTYKSSSSGQESQADSYASETDQQHSPTVGSIAEIETQNIPEQASKLQLDQDSHSQLSNSQEGTCMIIETEVVENIEQQNTDMLSSHRLSEDSGDSDSSSCKSDLADASVEISLCRSLPKVDALTDNKDKEDAENMDGLSKQDPNEDARDQKINDEVAEQSRQSSSPPSSPISGKSSSLNLNSLT